MKSKLVRLEGFEPALAEDLASRFRFPSLVNLALVVGRHLFANSMPDTDAIQRNLQGAETFEEKTEPVIGIYSTQGSGVAQGGIKHTFVVEVLLRLPREPQTGGDLLAELLDWMADNMTGKRVGRFIIKGTTIQTAPGGYIRISDASMFASARVRFLAVPTI